jgi:hypothetical protein
MTDLTLTKIRMRNGTWEGRISGGPAGVAPDVAVRYLDQPVDGVRIGESPEAGCWDISIPVPAHALTDGVHTFLITDETANSRLGDFSLIAGDPVADDLRAEVELLRAELDMLKRAFRRHCLETM